MSYQVSISRDMRGALNAETCIPLGQNRRELRISTRKTSRGMVCSAMAVQVSEDGRSYMFAPFSDFGRTLAHDRAARCTEKTVRAMHAAGLAQADDLIRAASAHYSPAQSAAVPA